MTQLKRIGGPLMKKLVCFAVIFLGLSVIAMAQDFPRGEIFLGYSHFMCDNSTYALGSSRNRNCTYNGWDLSIAINGNKWLSFIADFGGYYNTDSPPAQRVPALVQDHYHAYSFLVGPRFSVRKFKKVTPFIQGLFGNARVTPGIDFWPYENDLAMAFGGGVDIQVYKNISFRPIQLEYMAIKSGQPLRDNIRYNVGFSYNFGSVAK